MPCKVDRATESVRWQPTKLSSLSSRSIVLGLEPGRMRSWKRWTNHELQNREMSRKNEMIMICLRIAFNLFFSWFLYLSVYCILNMPMYLRLFNVRFVSIMLVIPLDWRKRSCTDRVTSMNRAEQSMVFHRRKPIYTILPLVIVGFSALSSHFLLSFCCCSYFAFVKRINIYLSIYLNTNCINRRLILCTGVWILTLSFDHYRSTLRHGSLSVVSKSTR